MTHRYIRREHRSRSGLLHLTGWRLHHKLALALAIPMLLAALLGGTTVASDMTQANGAATSGNQVSVLRPAIDQLTAAHTAMVAQTSSSTTTNGSPEALRDALAGIESAAEDLEQARDHADLSSAQHEPLDTILDLGLAIRENATTGTATQTKAQLRQLQSGTLQLIEAISVELPTPETGLTLLSRALHGRFSLALQQTLTTPGTFDPSESFELFSELGAEAATIDRIAATPDTTVNDLRTDNHARTRDAITDITDLDYTPSFEVYDDLITSTLDDIETRLADTAADTRTHAIVNAVVTLGALLASLALALYLFRVLLAPIHRVREEALKITQTGLPDAVARIRAGSPPGPVTPIAVHTHDEVGQLARAVDDLHQQSVTLAIGGATLRKSVDQTLLTMSRRSTRLVNQQLTLLETLEDVEEDPVRLEHLFTIDHLAARLRRNANSLLVLVDAPNPATGWETLSIGNCLMASTVGVQDYRRVLIESSPSTRVTQATAPDLVAVLTELVDNALSNSSVATTVRLSADRTPDGVRIAVIDTGHGLGEQTLEQINAHLTGDAHFTPDTTHRMGLFVVNRLAKRHGIVVNLEHNQGQGITARVLVPDSCLQDPPDPASVDAIIGNQHPSSAPEAPVHALAAARRTIPTYTNTPRDLGALVDRLLARHQAQPPQDAQPHPAATGSPGYAAVIDQLMTELDGQ